MSLKEVWAEMLGIAPRLPRKAHTYIPFARVEGHKVTYPGLLG